LLYSSGDSLVNGWHVLLTTPDILVSDAIALGGLGAALVNVGCVGLLALGVMKIAGVELKGLALGTLGLATGFAFLGKNPLNILPIILGGYLYSKYKQAPFKDYALVAILSSCLAPVVTQLLHFPQLSFPVAISCGLALGIAVGFIMPPLATTVRQLHHGYNLYNVGFAAGFLGVLIYTLWCNMGLKFTPASIWSSDCHQELAIFLGVLSCYYLLCAWGAGDAKFTLRDIIFTDKLHSNYGTLPYSLIYTNMGFLGLSCLLLVMMLKGTLCGPVMSSILAVVGFAAAGKSITSGAPVVAGVFLAAGVSNLVLPTPLFSSSVLSAAFFATALSPLCRRYGPFWGVVAGYLHLTLATNITSFHGGLNLYNNGFAAGLAAMLLLPIIQACYHEP